jgi:very-short-patch-repair endonuclease
VTEPAYSPRRRQQVERASQEWRSALIDVSGNNRLLFFKPSAATLDLTDVDPASMAELLAGKTVRLSRLFTDAVRIAAAQRACKALASKQREAEEEYGVAVAFCAFGLATWARDLDDIISQAEAQVARTWLHAPIVPEAIAAVGSGATPTTPTAPTPARTSGNGPAPASPVLLRAVELRQRQTGVDAWELTLSGDAQLNPVLIHVLSAQGAAIDEELILEAGDDTLGELEPIFERLSKACVDVSGFAIADRSMLGAFSYLKQPMVADCEDVEAMLTSDMVAALAGDEDAIARARTQVGDVSESDPDYKPVESEFLVLDADASQSFVVNAALAGRNLVVQGPPGTGKSQTIGNVIASLVAEGKRVLFVAQKRAAITAVLDRLETVGLGEVTLDLFAAGASRRYVAEQLRNVLDRQATVGAPVTGALHQTLGQARNRLVSHRNAMNTSRHAWGVTVTDLLALSYGVPRATNSGIRLPATTLSAWGPNDLELYASSLGELAGKGGLDPGRTTRPGWSPSALITNERVAAANQLLISIQAEQLPAANRAVDVVAVEFVEFGSGLPRDLAGERAVLAWLAEGAYLAAQIPGALDPAVDAASIQRMLAATNTAYRKKIGMKLGWSERRKLRKSAQALVAPNASPPVTDTNALHQLLLRANAAREAWVRNGGQGGIRPLSTVAPAQAALDQLVQGLTSLQPYLQHVQLDALPRSDLAGTLATLADDRSRAQMPRLHELEVQLETAGVSSVLAALRHDPLVASDTVAERSAADLLRYVAVRSALDQALTTDPALAAVSGHELHATVETFQRADPEHLQANAARVRRAVAVRTARVLDEHPTQHVVLKKEVTKRRNFLPVRKLFNEAPDVMTAVKPCWAMSPLQVSRLLPASFCFDVVIFDEASQVKPADAIPAMIRAPQVVIAGDSRQLPPTEFFTKVLEDPPDTATNDRAAAAAAQEALAAEAAEEDAELDEPAPVVTPAAESFTRDTESILSAADRILAGQSRRLLWHYRSRDERLIAVSNAYVYDNSLTTFPAGDGADCLRHVVVPASPGIRNTTNSPEAEVREVVALVLEHARERPGETLGVITFGIAHQRRIEAALEAQFAADSELQQILNSNDREPFFVKNIERVQGDERDSVILTIGYGKSADGRLRLFWGPLLQPGGERRLNVAISRARKRMTLVTSFGADDVTEETHASAGFALMFRFIRFMASGGTELTGGKTDVPLNAFEMDIRDRLQAAGLDLVPQLGVGSYRLDFAVRHPDHPGRYVLAIEADGAAYHSGHVARERDRLRQRLLEARGWTFHRIWSTDWFNDADVEVARAVAAFDAAVKKTDDNEAKAPAETTPEPASWHVAEATRSLPRPPVSAGLTIDAYSPDEIVSLVRYVRSDGLVRTRDDELLLLMKELGFSKRGARIVAALRAAQDAAG